MGSANFKLPPDQASPTFAHISFEEDLRQNRLPDLPALKALFAPSSGSLPEVAVRLGDLSAYDQLLQNASEGVAA